MLERGGHGPSTGEGCWRLLCPSATLSASTNSTPAPKKPSLRRWTTTGSASGLGRSATSWRAFTAQGGHLFG